MNTPIKMQMNGIMDRKPPNVKMDCVPNQERKPSIYNTF